MQKRGNKLNTTLFDLIDIIYKTGKLPHLEKLQIIQNVNKLMFQAIFIFSDWILIEHIIASSSRSVCGETDSQKILPRVLSGGLGHE